MILYHSLLIESGHIKFQVWGPKKLKIVLDNQSGLMYDIRVASEKNSTKFLIGSRTELLPVRVPKYQKNRIYDNLTEMQP